MINRSERHLVTRASSDHCDFCGRPLAEIGKLVVSQIGGTPAAICITCVIDAAMSLGFVVGETRQPSVAAD